MTKPDKIDLILQLILEIFGTMKTLSFDLGIALGTFFLASINDRPATDINLPKVNYRNMPQKPILSFNFNTDSI